MRGRPFARGGDARQCRRLEAAALAAGPVPFDLYSDMRHVYSNPKLADVTEGQRRCRAWLSEDRKAFMAKLADLEVRYREAGVEGGVDDVVVTCEQLLAECVLTPVDVREACAIRAWEWLESRTLKAEAEALREELRTFVFPEVSHERVG